ncbi:uncharacterized protein LOC141910074 isoform X1 [Tubulanus polymorphus]|uniref:uncharacterized protein LOC141910074 isoform X1 n=1 Tax=Tubulanus polymorphus TaxID=672921 RepID=UPI003DA3319A
MVVFEGVGVQVHLQENLIRRYIEEHLEWLDEFIAGADDQTWSRWISIRNQTVNLTAQWQTGNRDDDPQTATTRQIPCSSNPARKRRLELLSRRCQAAARNWKRRRALTAPAVHQQAPTDYDVDCSGDLPGASDNSSHWKLKRSPSDAEDCDDENVDSGSLTLTPATTSVGGNLPTTAVVIKTEPPGGEGEDHAGDFIDEMFYSDNANLRIADPSDSDFTTAEQNSFPSTSTGGATVSLNYSQNTSPGSTTAVLRKRPKNRDKIKRTLTRAVVCLAETDALLIPDRDELARLLASGLGLRKITFNANGSKQDLSDKLYEEYPKLKRGGGFEILNPEKNSRTILKVVHVGAIECSRLGEVSASKFYVRPLQVDLSRVVDVQTPHSGGTIACVRCRRRFKINDIRSHREKCFV